MDGYKKKKKQASYSWAMVTLQNKFNILGLL